MKHVNLPLPDDLHKKLKIHCAESGQTMVDVLRNLTEDYLKKVEKRKAKS
jgi:plasmid stability protein